MRVGDTARSGSRPGEYVGVRRGIAVMALVWQGAWMLADGGLRLAVEQAGAGLLFLAALIVWLVLALALAVRAGARFVSLLSAIDVALLLLMAALLLIATATEKSSAGLSMCLLAVGVTGLLLPLRAALPLACLIVGIETVGLLAAQLDGGTPGSWYDLLSPAYAIAVGIASIAGRHFALQAARASDEAAETLVALEEQSTILRSSERELLARERLLHETALNTLTAIARGGGLDPVTVRAQCAEGAKALCGMAQTMPRQRPRDARMELSGAVLTAEASGCAVDITGLDADALNGVPGDVADAVLGAMREGLLNAVRHAGATTITVELHAADGRLTGAVRDDGCGFDSVVHDDRLGVRNVIVEGMSLVGGTGRVQSSLGHGTTVSLEWRPAGGRIALASGANGVALPILVGFLGFAAISLAATISLADRPMLDVAGLLVAIAAALLALPGRRVGALPAWRVIAVCVVAPGAYLLQNAAFVGTPATPWADWSAEAMVGILLTLTCVGPWWAWMPALASWLATMGDPLAELLQPGTAVIIGGALFARSVRRSHRAHTAAIVRRLEEGASAAASAQAVAVIGRRYALLRSSGAEQLLLDIAEGRRDPADPQTREACRREEQHLRTLMRLDPGIPVHAFAGALLERARGRGVMLEIDIAADVRPAADELAAMRVACDAAVDHAVTGDTMRLSARREGGAAVVRLVGMLAAAPNAVAGVSTEVDDEGSAVLEAVLA